MNFVVTIWGKLYVKVLRLRALPGSGLEVGMKIAQEDSRAGRK